MTFGFIAGVFWFYWFAMISGHPANQAERLLRLQPGYTPTFEPLHFAIALLATLLAILGVLSLRAHARARER